MTGDAAPIEAAAPPADRYPELVELFIRMCETPSPSRDERAMADLVRAELGAMDVAVEEDSSGSRTGSNSGNLLARIPGPEGAPVILLCAHLDTVPLEGPVEVVRRDGVLTNRHEAILGADNKAAVAVFIEAARRLLAEGAPAAGVELLFTTCEELALDGAKNFDMSRLAARTGFVFDHASAVGDLVSAAPTYYRVGARFHGAAAHAGICPEDGNSAIEAAARALANLEFGRHDEDTTSNAGTIRGGSATNVVAERCELELEARSLDPEKASARVGAMVDALTEAAAETGCDLETDVAELFRAYRLPAGAPALDIASRALRDAGIEPRIRASGGGSDAHVLTERGIPSVNVANGTERPHEPTESVSVWALETMLDVALGLVRASA